MLIMPPNNVCPQCQVVVYTTKANFAKPRARQKVQSTTALLCRGFSTSVLSSFPCYWKRMAFLHCCYTSFSDYCYNCIYQPLFLLLMGKFVRTISKPHSKVLQMDIATRSRCRATTSIIITLTVKRITKRK